MECGACCNNFFLSLISPMLSSFQERTFKQVNPNNQRPCLSSARYVLSLIDLCHCCTGRPLATRHPRKSSMAKLPHSAPLRTFCPISRRCSKSITPAHFMNGPLRVRLHPHYPRSIDSQKHLHFHRSVRSRLSCTHSPHRWSFGLIPLRLPVTIPSLAARKWSGLVGTVSEPTDVIQI